uniref:60S ribosomal protein L18a n=1 Tax=Piliocolobus tephrosceles TaxID=591936 RepID=A0A8C9H2R4_9PRIM
MPRNLDRSLKTNIKQFHIVGRATPTEKDKNPTVYRMCIFAKNDTNAKSKFWYFIKRINKIKESNGELLACEQLKEQHPFRVKNYGVLLRYSSRTGTHNMYKEFRDTTKEGAIDQLYSEMAGRHRARASSINIIRISEIHKSLVRRPHIKQLLKKKLRFPALHLPTINKEFRRKFASKRPSTYRM